MSSQTPTFSEFVELVKSQYAADLCGEATVDFRTLVVKGDNRIVSFDLDKMYRFFVDLSLTKPDLSAEELITGLKVFSNKHRTEDQKSTALFDISPETAASFGEMKQGCIR